MVSPDLGFSMPRQVDLVQGLGQSAAVLCPLHPHIKQRVRVEGEVGASFLSPQSDKSWNSVSIYSTNIYWPITVCKHMVKYWGYSCEHGQNSLSL